jgi:transcriptional regulator with XRE-family HTH domain
VVSERRAFGDRARRQRERRGVTLEAIANATKIPASLFAGLERGDCSRWPAGVYSRAYVRAYAEAIGLDPNEAVEDFTAAFAETVWPDGTGAPAKRLKAVPALRLSMDDEPERRQARTMRRMAFGGIDLLVVSTLVALTHFALDTALWPTISVVALTYYTGERFVSDEPLVAWLVGRFRTPPPAAEIDAAEDVAVTDVARTTA